MEGIKVFLFSLYIAAFTSCWWMSAIYDNERRPYLIISIVWTIFNTGYTVYWLITHWNDKEVSE